LPPLPGNLSRPGPWGCMCRTKSCVPEQGAPGRTGRGQLPKVPRDLPLRSRCVASGRERRSSPRASRSAGPLCVAELPLRCRTTKQRSFNAAGSRHRVAYDDDENRTPPRFDGRQHHSATAADTRRLLQFSSSFGALQKHRAPGAAAVAGARTLPWSFGMVLANPAAIITTIASNASTSRSYPRTTIIDARVMRVMA
jgi:hypothetical protein